MLEKEFVGFMRRNQATDQIEVVNCPYGWIPIHGGSPQSVLSLSLPEYVKACAAVGSALCIGSCCAIYPCERVWDFVEGKI